MAVIAVCAIGARSDGAKDLTDANFDDEVIKSGKFAFVKFWLLGEATARS